MNIRRNNGFAVDQALMKASREWMWKHREINCLICGSNQVRFTEDKTSIFCLTCGSIVPGLEKDEAA